MMLLILNFLSCDPKACASTTAPYEQRKKNWRQRMPASEARSAMLQHCLRDDRLRAKASSERAPPFAISKSGEPSTPCHQQLVQRYFVAICSERWTRPTRSSSSQSDGVVDTSIRTEQCATLRLFRAGGKGANECSPYTVSLRTSNSSFPCAGFFGSPYCHVECGCPASSTCTARRTTVYIQCKNAYTHYTQHCTVVTSDAVSDNGAR